MMKLFEVVIDDGISIFRRFELGKNKKAVLDVVRGNGEVIKCVDSSKDFLPDVSFLADTLAKAQYGEAEIKLITGLVANFCEGVTGKPVDC